ncbi:MAG: leucine--tRNA ligase [Myxococcota bacterium]|jgi:leucyl-tRNA synthetase|nr:leucine--tRNA ligase [Myxococcota bacterium]
MTYSPAEIEPRWQAYWLENETFKAVLDTSKPKYYVLDMFPYPSGDGLHVGHPEGYTATDILARYKRMKGFNVLHPMGWDAFGLPAEQYAIKTGTHPRITTERNVTNFRRQIQSLGFSYDWSREIDTTRPDYARWTQWIFTKLHELGLAYQAEVPVNWCPELGTVLANEEVIDGRSEVGGHPVVRLPLRQWMLRITRYAERLLDDLDDLDWPEPIKKMQREWIGRSEGARVRFNVADEGSDGVGSEEIEVFTTRPDTLFGATYMVLAPEHPLVGQITTTSERANVDAYIQKTQRRSERDRMADNNEKTGAFTGAYAVNPVNQKRIPIWIADYVLAAYGTGAIMAVPGHDDRDYLFAQTYDLPIVEVVEGGNLDESAYTGPGKAINSDFLDGLDTPAAKKAINEWLESENQGEAAITYKLRDWLFSRQRYWGEPFPIIHLRDGSIVPLPEDELPLTLPEMDDFKPTGENFEAPLARVPDWIKTTDPATGEPALRDPNTMPQWAGSCWYFLRFTDPTNQEEAWSQEAERYWMPVDLYVGGSEHAVLHLLYARFWHKVFFDLGLVHTREPFQKLVNQGMILGESFRYYDDNLEDDPNAETKFYPSGQVDVSDEGPRLAKDGSPLKVRWAQTVDARVDKESGEVRHAQFPDLELERVMEKMSKSRGNVVNPDDVVQEFGADSMRLYEMFIGPLEKAAPWSTDGIQGIYRFLQRCWRLIMDDSDEGSQVRSLPEGAGSEEQQRLVARTITGVGEDIEAMRFNTAISKLMVFVRDIARNDELTREIAEKLVLMLAPMAPHLAEELWSQLGHSATLAYAPWPEVEDGLLEEETIKLVIQVNGKKRDELVFPKDASEDDLKAKALVSEKVQAHLAGREARKIIVVPGRLINIVG